MILAAFKIVVPAGTSMLMLSMVTLNNGVSDIIQNSKVKIQKSK